MSSESPSSSPPPDPDIAHLVALLGTWRGRGRGDYPTIDDFEYLEEVTIGHVGKPFLSYAQKTRDAHTDLPLHAESGYFRPVGVGEVELVVAQPSGIVELHTGAVTAGQELRLELATLHVHTTPTAKSVTEVTRSITIAADTMHYEVAMAAVGQPLQHHLTATLQRITD